MPENLHKTIIPVGNAFYFFAWVLISDPILTWNCFFVSTQILYNNLMRGLWFAFILIRWAAPFQPVLPLPSILLLSSSQVSTSRHNTNTHCAPNYEYTSCFFFHKTNCFKNICKYMSRNPNCGMRRESASVGMAMPWCWLFIQIELTLLREDYSLAVY